MNNTIKNNILGGGIVIGGLITVATIITEVAKFTTLTTSEIIDALMGFLPVAVSVEISLAGFTIAILVLLLSLISSSDPLENKTEMKNLTRTPQLVMWICLIGVLYSGLTHLFISAGFYNCAEPSSLLWMIIAVVFEFLAALGTFALLAYSLTQYGLKSLNRKQPNITNHHILCCKKIRGR